VAIATSKCRMSNETNPKREVFL